MGLLWDNIQPNNNDLVRLRTGFTIANMDPQTALGYKLGNYLGNMFRNKEETKARHALQDQPEQAASLAEKSPDGSYFAMGTMAGANNDGLYNMISQYKQDYMNAQAAGDQTGMNAAHQAAEHLRNSQNIDWTGYGANDAMNQNRLSQMQQQAQGAADWQNNAAKHGYTPMLLNGLLGEEGNTQGKAGLLDGLLEPKKPGNLVEDYVRLGATFGFPFDSAAPYGAAVQADPERIIQEANSSFDTKLRQHISPMTSDEYYDMLYNKLRDNGVGPDMARKVAGQKAMVYKANRLSAYANGLSTNGITDGSINEIGQKILSQIALEKPEAYQNMLNMYALPKDQYATKVGRENAAIQHQYGLENAAVNHGYNTENMNRQFALNQQGASNDLERKKDFAQFNLGNKKDFLEFTTNLKRQLNNANMQDRVAFMEAIGVPKDAIQMAVAGIKPVAGENNAKLYLEQANKIIEEDQKWSEMNPGKEYPDKEAHDWAVNTRNQILGIGTPQESGETGDTKQINDYNQAIQYTTDILMQNKERGQSKIPKETMIHLIRQRTGDMADNIINNIKWKDFGY